MIKSCKIINMNEVNKITNKNSDNLSQALEKVIDKIVARVEREVPDKGYFRSFAENFEKGTKTDLFARDIALFIERDEAREGRAFLGISVLHPTMSLEASNYFINGDRKRLVEFLKNPEFKEKLKNEVVELSEYLKNK